ncbi:hypothetical protein [Cyclobacterium lianum]|uniref:hypothetical protein n=1 Tax=Cyclobacterium lianum TaxID=388280 RepID=UPI0015B6C931|nr:hypothetical protein [Cyclobacterium lianum]
MRFANDVEIAGVWVSNVAESVDIAAGNNENQAKIHNPADFGGIIQDLLLYS